MSAPAIVYAALGVLILLLLVWILVRQFLEAKRAAERHRELVEGLLELGRKMRADLAHPLPLADPPDRHPRHAWPLGAEDRGPWAERNVAASYARREHRLDREVALRDLGLRQTHQVVDSELRELEASRDATARQLERKQREAPFELLSEMASRGVMENLRPGAIDELVAAWRESLALAVSARARRPYPRILEVGL